MIGGRKGMQYFGAESLKINLQAYWFVKQGVALAPIVGD